MSEHDIEKMTHAFFGNSIATQRSFIHAAVREARADFARELLQLMQTFMRSGKPDSLILQEVLAKCHQERDTVDAF